LAERQHTQTDRHDDRNSGYDAEEAIQVHLLFVLRDLPVAYADELFGDITQEERYLLLGRVRPTARKASTHFLQDFVGVTIRP